MRNGARQPAYRRELFGAQQRLLGSLGFRNIDTKHQNARKISVHVTYWLINEIQNAFFQPLRALDRQCNGDAPPYIGLAGCINFVQKAGEPLFFNLGHRFAHRFPITSRLAMSF